MSDTFKNFYSSTKTAGDFIIIPVADGSTRDLASLLEVHDLIITASANESSLNENWQAIIDIYIKDNGNNYFLYNYIILKDGESWHNEKSFSIMFNQSLYYKVRNDISNGTVTVTSSCFQREDKDAEYCSLTLTTNPANANATLTCGSLYSTNKNIRVPSGSTVSYTVSASNYETKTGNITVISDTTFNVDLERLYYIKITTNAENSTIILTATGYTQQGDLIYVKKGTTVSYTVSAPNYVQKSGTITIDSNNPKNITRQITLEYKKYTFTINPTPNDSNVILTADGYTQTGNSILIPYNTEVTYNVSKQGYITQSDSYKNIKNTTKNIVLEMAPNSVIFESNEPVNTNINLSKGYYEIIVVGGSGGSSSSGGGGGHPYVSGTKEAIGGS